MMDRRNFLAAMLAGCAAPAVVKVGSLMRIKPIMLLEDLNLTETSLLGLLEEMNGVQKIASLKELWPGISVWYNGCYGRHAL